MKPRDSQIEYHDYLAIVCRFDDSAWVRMGRSVPDLVGRQFTTACQNYFDTLDSHRRNWAQRAGLSTDYDPFPAYLYNPACFIAFGHTDHIGLVLVDDIEATTAVTADSSSTVEQIHLAYCPKLASLGIENELFVEPHALFDGTRRASQADGSLPEGYVPGSHSVEKAAPLLLWAKFKLNGLAILGSGLQVQQAAYRCIADRIEEVRQLLLVRAKRDGAERAARGGLPLIEEEDLEPGHIRIAVLDPQGAEDITLLMFVRNYSVGW